MRAIVLHSFTGGVGRSTTAVALTLVASRDHSCVVMSGSDDLATIAGIPDQTLGDPPFVNITDDSAQLANTLHTEDYLRLPDETLHVWDGIMPQGLLDALPLEIPPINVLCMQSSYLSFKNTHRAILRFGLEFEWAIVRTHEGDALTVRDCARVVSMPEDRVISIPTDASIARAADAGLLATRLPRVLTVALMPLVDDAMRPIRPGAPHLTVVPRPSADPE